MDLKRIKQALIALIGLATFSPSLIAQNDLPTEQVEVVKDFNARLLDAERFLLTPKIPNTDTSRRAAPPVELSDRQLQIQYAAPRIRPLGYRSEFNQEIYPGYARLGVGLPGAILVVGSYDFVNEESANFGLDIRHHSVDNNKNVENQRFANNNLGLHGNFYSDAAFAVEGDLGYSRDFYYFYGYNDLDDDFDSDLTYAPEDVRQRFSTIHGRAKIFNSELTVADFNYSAQVDFYFMEDFYAARENGFDIELNGTKWFDEQHPLSVTLITDFTAYQDTGKQSLNNIFLQPNFTYHGDRFRAKIGANFAAHEDEFYIYPDAEVGINIIENILTAYVGTEGGLYKNNFRNLTDFNPFMESRIQLENSFYNNFYGGIKGDFLDITYQAEIGYKTIDNLALFVVNNDSIPRFFTVYDTGSVASLSVQGTIPLFENLDLLGSFEQYAYTLENEDKPWHLPSTTLKAGAIWKLFDQKLRLQGELYVENGVPFKTEDGQTGSLNGLLDLTTIAEYQFTDNISGFVQINNLTNNRRQRWKHYPVFGTNGMIGISARF